MTTKLAAALAAVAASTATAAAVALPAIGSDGPNANPTTKPAAGGQAVVRESARPAELRACLKRKGLTAPDGDVDLKRWIIGQLDEGKGDEIKGCFAALDPNAGKGDVREGTKETHGDEKKAGDDRPGPSFDDLRKCLEGKGFDPPADPRALKEWLGPHLDKGQPLGDAAQACFESLPPKPPSEYGPSERERFGDGS